MTYSILGDKWYAALLPSVEGIAHPRVTAAALQDRLARWARQSTNSVVMAQLSGVTRGDVLDDWIVSRNVGRTAEKFGLPTKEVRKLIHDAAITSRIPQSVRIDIHGEVLTLQTAIDVLWPRVMKGKLKAIEVWRRLGVSLHALTGWVVPASSGFHPSVNAVAVTTGSAKLEQLLDSLMALPPPEADKEAEDEADHPD